MKHYARVSERSGSGSTDAVFDVDRFVAVSQDSMLEEVRIINLDDGCEGLVVETYMTVDEVLTALRDAQQ